MAVIARLPSYSENLLVFNRPQKARIPYCAVALLMKRLQVFDSSQAKSGFILPRIDSPFLSWSTPFSIRVVLLYSRFLNISSIKERRFNNQHEEIDTQGKTVDYVLLLFSMNLFKAGILFSRNNSRNKVVQQIATVTTSQRSNKLAKPLPLI